MEVLNIKTYLVKKKSYLYESVNVEADSEECAIEEAEKLFSGNFDYHDEVSTINIEAFECK